MISKEFVEFGCFCFVIWLERDTYEWLAITDYWFYIILGCFEWFKHALKFIYLHVCGVDVRNIASWWCKEVL